MFSVFMFATVIAYSVIFIYCNLNFYRYLKNKLISTPKERTHIWVVVYISSWLSLVEMFSVLIKVLFCKYCETTVDLKKRSSVIQHLKTVKHMCYIKRKDDQNVTKCQQLLTRELSSKKAKFSMDLCKAMISANIPFN